MGKDGLCRAGLRVRMLGRAVSLIKTSWLTPCGDCAEIPITHTAHLVVNTCSMNLILMLGNISYKGASDVVRHKYPSCILTEMHNQFWIFGCLVVVLILVVLAQADYIMDDTNSSIYYGGYWSQDPAPWNLDNSKLFYSTM
jgi:hypothetical protein